MSISMSNGSNDTSASFYSNIEKLFKLIDVSLEKEQEKNAEKYINYFFEVMIRFYQKSAKSSKITQGAGFPGRVTSNVGVEDATTRNIESLLPDRSINNVFGDFFADKIMRLLTSYIKSGGFETFYFVLARLKDSIRVLLKEKETYDKASLLLRQFKFVVDQIYSKQNSLSTYEKGWFLSESYNWFIEIYSGSVNTVDDIGILENEIIQVLRYYIDNDRVDLFEKFLERLSSNIFSYSFDRERAINTYKPKEHPASWEYDKIIRRYRSRTDGLLSLDEIKRQLKEMEKEIKEEFKQFSLSDEQISEFTEQFSRLLLDEYKETYLKVILIKTIVYSFFKKKYQFFEKYLNYNQPTDSDAIWASRYYGVTSLQEIFSLLERGEGLILRDNLFWIGHHGFSIYLNTFIGYFLIVHTDKDVLSTIKSIQDYNRSAMIEYELKNIKTKNFIIEIPFVNKNYDKETIEEKIDRFIKAVADRKEELDFKDVTEGKISIDILENFKKLFIEHFYKTCSMRSILKEYGLLNLTNQDSDANGIGVNQLLPKKAFMKENDVLYFNMHDSLASSLSDSESLSILFEIERVCKKIAMSQKDFEDYLNKNKENYDIILSKGRYIVKTDFVNLNFTESWSMTSPLNDIPDYLGVLENHYNVFYLRVPSKEGYVLLNSKKLGILNQFNPPSFKGAERFDIFNFSMIDFNYDSESLDLHVGEGMDKNDLLKNVWLRIFEKYRIEFKDDFIGTFIELNG